MRLPRSCESSSSASPSSSWSSSRTEPLTARRSRQQPHDRQRRRRLAAAGLAGQAEDLAAREVEVDPAHRGTSPASTEKVTVRSRTVEHGRRIMRPPRRRVERVAQPVTDQVDREHEEHEQRRRRTRTARDRSSPPRAVGDQRAERDVGRLHAEAEVGEPGLGDDRGADVDRRVDDQQRGDVREDVPEDDRAVATPM